MIRLSREPGSASLYFHQNAYTPDGKKLIITTPSGVSTIDLATHEIQQVVEGKVAVIVAGRKSGDIYYIKDRVTVMATNPTTKETRQIVTLPDRATVSSLNADETLLLGSITDAGPAIVHMWMLRLNPRRNRISLGTPTQSRKKSACTIGSRSRFRCR